MSDCDYQKCPNCNHDEHNVLSGVECSRSDCSCLADMKEAFAKLEEKINEAKDALYILGIAMRFAKGEN